MSALQPNPSFSALLHSHPKVLAAPVRLLLVVILLISTGGCSLLQPGQPASPPVSPVLPGEIPPTSPASPTPAPLPTQTLFLSATPLPTFTPLPSPTPFPTLTPYATLAPPDPAALGTPVTPTPTQSTALFGQCCTLRVYNGGSIPLWIGKKLPRGGSVIKPRWYLEFYFAEPQTVTVYWCLHIPVSKATPTLLPPHAPGAPALYECRHREVYVEEGVTETSVQ